MTREIIFTCQQSDQHIINLVEMEDLMNWIKIKKVSENKHESEYLLSSSHLTQNIEN